MAVNCSNLIKNDPNLAKNGGKRMGLRGPAPRPDALNALEGDPGNRRRNTDSPKPKPGAPTPPHWLKAEALAEWGRIVPELDSIGLLSVVDRAALTAYVCSWATFVECAEDIEDNGVMIRGRDGNSVKNPAVAMQRDALAQIKTWVTEFGLTPSARARMQLPSEKGTGEDASVSELFAV